MHARLLLLTLVIAVTDSCSGSSFSPSAVSAAPTTSQVQQTGSTWAGTTVQGGGITFSIAGTTVTNVGFTVVFPSDECGGKLTGGEGGSLGRIADGRLLLSGSIGLNLQWTLDGTVTTQGPAEGTLTVSYTGPITVPELSPCSARISVGWTAKRSS